MVPSAHLLIIAVLIIRCVAIIGNSQGKVLARYAQVVFLGFELSHIHKVLARHAQVVFLGFELSHPQICSDCEDADFSSS